jgi:hypothetical protein
MGLAITAHSWHTQMGEKIDMETPGQLVHVMGDTLGIAKATGPSS